MADVMSRLHRGATPERHKNKEALGLLPSASSQIMEQAGCGEFPRYALPPHALINGVSNYTIIILTASIATGLLAHAIVPYHRGKTKVCSGVLCNIIHFGACKSKTSNEIVKTSITETNFLCCRPRPYIGNASKAIDSKRNAINNK